MDMLIYKDPEDDRPHRIRTTLLFDIKAKMHNTHICRHFIRNSEDMEGLAP